MRRPPPVASQPALLRSLRATADGAQARRIVLDDTPFDWELKRTQRRSIGLRIDERGLRVLAPRWVTIAAIEAALHERSEWIVRTHAQWQALSQRRARLDPQWAHETRFEFFGEPLVLWLGSDTRRARRDGDRLELALPVDAEPERIRAQAESWLRRHAHPVFEQRTAHFARTLGVSPRGLSLSSARTRWGSCGPDGTIRLNWRLALLPVDIIDYVVAHEVAHLRELNHSPAFWAIVARLYPGYRQARAWLREFPEEA